MRFVNQVRNVHDGRDYIVSTIPMRISNLAVRQREWRQAVGWLNELGPSNFAALGGIRVNVNGQSAVYVCGAKRYLLFYVNWTDSKAHLEQHHCEFCLLLTNADVNTLYGEACEESYKTLGFSAIPEDRFVMRYLRRKPNVFLL